MRTEATSKPRRLFPGSFRNIAGVIKTMDASANQITLTDLVAHKPVTVLLTPDTAMRRLPPFMAAMLARRGAGGQNGGSAPAGGAPGGGSREGAAQGIPGPPRCPDSNEARRGYARGRQSCTISGRRKRAAATWISSDMLERMPQTQTWRT